MIRKNMVFLWVTALLPALLCLWFYPQLPAVIPTGFHNGTITQYGPKATIWLLGGLGPVIAALFTLLPMVDPRRKNYARMGSRYNLLAGGTNLFLLAMTGLLIAESLHPGSLHIENLVVCALGLLFAMMATSCPNPAATSASESAICGPSPATPSGSAPTAWPASSGSSADCSWFCWGFRRCGLPCSIRSFLR